MLDGTARIRPVGLVICLIATPFFQSVTGAETYVTRTNWVEKSITNVVEVRMPKNVFVNEYHTNWVEQVQTNVVVRELPRKVTVDFVHTNVITHYSTNYINKSEERMVYLDLLSTNFVDHFRTNVKVVRLTNDIAVNLVKTNFVERYRTNWQTLNFTNFQTVLVMKTNWVTQPVTNVVQLDLPAKSTASAPAVAAKPERPAFRSSPNTADGPILEGSKTSTQPDNHLVEVLLKVHWPETTDPRPVQRWKVEREDGTFMSVGQEQTFKKELPVGTYKIEATLKSGPPAQVLRGALIITGNEVVVRQKPSGKKLISAND
jgi:hypothetical protein